MNIKEAPPKGLTNKQSNLNNKSTVFCGTNKELKLKTVQESHYYQKVIQEFLITLKASKLIYNILLFKTRPPTPHYSQAIQIQID